MEDKEFLIGDGESAEDGVAPVVGVHGQVGIDPESGGGVGIRIGAIETIEG